MKTVIICYIILINLAAFLMMGIDKSRARRHRYRIPVKVLLFTAIIGGSIGILLGMYLFRHKTAKVLFYIGVPLILVLQLVLIFFLYRANKERIGSPSTTVQQELELIRGLDDDTISSYISYQNLTGPQVAEGEIGSEASPAVHQCFRKFKYRITGETLEDDSHASVNAEITNIDTKALAVDLCTELTRRSLQIYPEPEPLSTGDYYSLFHQILNSHTYNLVTTNAVFHLIKDESGWIIMADDQLSDELVSGFITNMNDPYLLSATDFLTMQLDEFRDFSTENWRSFLNLQDVFQTGSETYAPMLDQVFLDRLASSFDYNIIRCTETGSQATAEVRVTSLDLHTAMDQYQEAVVSYAKDPKNLRADSQKTSDEMIRMLLDALKADNGTASTDIQLKLANNGTSWSVSLGSDFTNALMGDVAGALESF